MIYIVFFIVATMLSFCSEFARNRGNKYFYGLLVILLIVTVSILNGTRDFTIGTDIRVYGNKYFELALFSYRFVDYLDLTRSFYNLDVEYGYQALNYLVSRFTNNIHIFYFILGILTNGLFYLGITRFRQWVSIPLSFLTYLFLFYGNTLNIMRQSVAMAFVFLGISLFITSKKRLGIAMLFCSLLFHNSAIVGFAILLLYI
ncbi:EpsG family protein, partial [Enterococcus sp. 7E2_DIV0204]